MTTTFVLMAGLPGTGKSTLALALAKATSGVVLSKDTIRAALFPSPLTDYTEEQDDLCFGALLLAAAYVAHHPPLGQDRGRYIFLDGRTFRKRSQIANAIAAAEGSGCAWLILHLTCPDELALARIAEDRRASAHPAHNRDELLYFKSKSSFEPIDYPCLQVDTSAPLQRCLERCLAHLASREL